MFLALFILLFSTDCAEWWKVILKMLILSQPWVLVQTWERLTTAFSSSRLENDLLFSEWHRHTQKKEIRVLLSGVEPKTFRLLVRVLYHWATGDSWKLRPLNYVHGTNIPHIARIWRLVTNRSSWIYNKLVTMSGLPQTLPTWGRKQWKCLTYKKEV